MPLYHRTCFSQTFIIFFFHTATHFTIQLRQGRVLSHLTFRRVHSEHASRFLRIEKLISYNFLDLIRTADV